MPFACGPEAVHQVQEFVPFILDGNHSSPLHRNLTRRCSISGDHHGFDRIHVDVLHVSIFQFVGKEEWMNDIELRHTGQDNTVSGAVQSPEAHQASNPGAQGGQL